MRSKFAWTLFVLALLCAVSTPAWAQGREGGSHEGRAPSGAIPSPYDCCVNVGGVGCSDPTCEAAVCAADPFCCDTAWDNICVGEAFTLCDLCINASTCCISGGGGGGGAPSGVGCDDPTCEAAVCAVDSFCCTVGWDSVCAGEAWELCAVCGAYVPPIIQEIPTLSKSGLGILAAAMLLGGALLLRRRRAA